MQSIITLASPCLGSLVAMTVRLQNRNCGRCSKYGIAVDRNKVTSWVLVDNINPFSEKKMDDGTRERIE